jgi:hypothetical protein
MEIEMHNVMKMSEEANEVARIRKGEIAVLVVDKKEL